MATHKEQRDTANREKPKEAVEESKESEIQQGHQAKSEAQAVISKAPVTEPRHKEYEALLKSVQEEKDKAEQYLTSLKYLKAEFENYQKRTAKEMEELLKRGSERLARKLIVVVDDFERTINASRAAGDQSRLLTGVEMILKEIIKILKSEGVVKIEAVGKKFDTALHEAVMVSRTDEYSPGTVVEELRPGYMFDGRVIRPSMVTVSKPPDKQTDHTGKKGEVGSERETSDA